MWSLIELQQKVEQKGQELQSGVDYPRGRYLLILAHVFPGILSH